MTKKCNKADISAIVKMSTGKCRDQLARLSKGLAHPARVEIVGMLADRPPQEKCVCGEIVDALPLAQSTVSQHLKVLKETGWIRGEIDRPRVCYCLVDGIVAYYSALMKRCIKKDQASNWNGKETNWKRENQMVDKTSVLFLCTGNSCRSQMAEGFCRHLKGEQIEVSSAGIEAHGLNSYAVQVMKEVGIDISHQKSKTVDALGDRQFDYVITVCGHANDSCPVFPAKTRIIHRGFDDPPQLAKQAKTEEEVLDCYRPVRDEIKAYIVTLPEALTKE